MGTANSTSLIATIICVLNLAIAKSAEGSPAGDCLGDCVWPDASACSDNCICSFSNRCVDPDTQR